MRMRRSLWSAPLMRGVGIPLRSGVVGVVEIALARWYGGVARAEGVG
jgi:hypothetical protein